MAELDKNEREELYALRDFKQRMKTALERGKQQTALLASMGASDVLEWVEPDGYERWLRWLETGEGEEPKTKLGVAFEAIQKWRLLDPWCREFAIKALLAHGSREWVGVGAAVTLLEATAPKKENSDG